MQIKKILKIIFSMMGEKSDNILLYTDERINNLKIQYNVVNTKNIWDNNINDVDNIHKAMMILESNKENSCGLLQTGSIEENKKIIIEALNKFAGKELYDEITIKDIEPYDVISFKEDEKDLLEINIRKGCLIIYANKVLLDDEDIIKLAIIKNSKSLQHASQRLKNNKELVLLAVSNNGYLLRYVSDELKNNKDVVLSALNNNGLSLQYAHFKLKNDKDIVLSAVSKNGLALEYASDNLKNDEAVVMTALRNNDSVSHYIGIKLKQNDMIMGKIVSKVGIALEYASDSVKNDKKIVLKAVSQNGYALRYSSRELKNDKEVVLAACLQNEKVISYASDEMKEEIGSHDPVKFLNSIVLHKILQNHVVIKEENKSTKVKI